MAIKYNVVGNACRVLITFDATDILAAPGRTAASAAGEILARAVDTLSRSMQDANLTDPQIADLRAALAADLAARKAARPVLDANL